MADLDLSGRALGEFVLREQIGAGGYGAVYRCEQPVLERDAVVKVLHAGRQRNNAAKERFLREARLASRLDHPYAAHVYSFGADDGLLWIAMELVQGTTLGDLLKSRGPMPLDQFVPFFECVAQVVQAAHDRGIVHRDLKPSNMMVTESGGRLFPKLLDFGIAKLNADEEHVDEPTIDEPTVDEPADGTDTVRIRITPQRVQRTRTDPNPAERLTRRGVVMGSAPYMSPEQWADPCGVGPATDIYSLGCVAYEALTGRAPFTATNTDEYYHQHLRVEPPPLGDAFSPDLDRVLRRALAKAPEVRHASALELAAEFRAVLRALPREQLRSAAQHWQDRARAPSLLWGRDVLAGVERLTQPASRGALSELECSFVAASQRRVHRIRWLRRALAVLAVAGAFGGLQYRSAVQAELADERARLAEQQARTASQLAEVRITESELEQGRAALLHGEAEAQAHLTEAYKRDPLPSTAFMLARAIEPRLMEQARLPSTYGRMLWATFSPDGTQIATADDRNAQIWDGRTYQLLYTLPHGGRVNHVVYSAGGTLVVTAGEAVVHVWDAHDGALIRELTAGSGHKTVSTYYRSSISPDGKLVAAIDGTGSIVHVWDVVTAVVVAELRGPAGDWPDLAFSPDGWLAMTGGGELRVFDTRTWARILTIPGSVHALAFDAHSHLVTGTTAGDVTVWSLPSGAQLLHLAAAGEAVEAVAFSADGQRLAAGSRDGTLQIWRADSGAPVSKLDPRHGRVLAMEFDRTAGLVLAASSDGTVVVVDVEQGLPIALLDG
ncbi:MAG TPA: protein kinase, partial [Kofleriaceae bacterium]|nr:protein kinase [Kofleriaceae bacterium]